jgi:hypothetical protein
MIERPPVAEPRQISMPAAARPGATTVGGVISRFLESVLARLLILTAESRPMWFVRRLEHSPTLERRGAQLYACDTPTNTVKTRLMF